MRGRRARGRRAGVRLRRLRPCRRRRVCGGDALARLRGVTLQGGSPGSCTVAAPAAEAPRASPAAVRRRRRATRTPSQLSRGRRITVVRPMRPLGRGTDHVAYLAEGDLVVRCVEGGDPAVVVREADVLAAVAEISPLPCPSRCASTGTEAASP